MLDNITNFLMYPLLPMVAAALIVLTPVALVLAFVNPAQANNDQPAYAQEIINVGDIKWLCLTDHDKPISCQLISPLTDDKLNNYKHINVL